jgi:N-acylglucosamine-6-phosphate 2-epimerase
MNNQEIIKAIKGKLIVSCQALKNEPLHSSFIMGRMAYAAFLGGAGGIRANTVEDIHEIRVNVSLPIIGIIKHDYPDTPVVITPTMNEVNALMQEGVEIIAMDATQRKRHGGITIAELFPEVRRKYPNQLFMADCGSYRDAQIAQDLGFDLIGTTLNGYTEDSCQVPPPNFAFMKQLVSTLNKPVIAEGGIFSPEQLRYAMDQGVHACVVGSAITRPLEITKRYVAALR